MAKEIPLTQGKVALVDDDMYNYLMQWKWFYNNGYAGRHVGPRENRKRIALHRFIIQAPDGMDVDHINMNKLDCRRSNLRVATRSQNNANRLAPRNSPTGFKGVRYMPKNCRSKPWQAFIRFAHRKIYLGIFATAEDAASAYDEKAKELFGEFARTNF